MNFAGQAPVNHYGAAGAYYGAGGPLQSPATALGDVVPQIQKGSFLRGYRRRLNVGSLLLCLILPWALFSILYVATSFELHYEFPTMCTLIVALGFLATLLTGIVAVSTRVKSFTNPEHEPTWLFFLTLSMLLACVLAVLTGNSNYSTNMRPYYDMRNLNEYVNISTKTMRGQQLMDAGIINFESGTQLDITRSMGFKSDTVYCVAPITSGDLSANDTLATYDFWAVGTECCSGSQADFHCSGFRLREPRGGLRVLGDSSRAFYRLAVQQAEAAYKIKAVHPLFFTWTSNPHDAVDGWQIAGRSHCVMWIVGYFIFQCFLVAVVTLAFSKLGIP